MNQKRTIFIFTFILSCLFFTVNAENSHKKEFTDQLVIDKITLKNQFEINGYYKIGSIKTLLTWGSTNVRYEQSIVQNFKVNRTKYLSAWIGERINAQALVWTRDGLDNLTYEISDFQNDNGTFTISSESVSAGFVKHVMTDELNKDKKGACGDRPDPTLFDSLLVADIIDSHIKSIDVNEMSTQVIWLSCDIPYETVPGKYQGEIVFKGNELILGKLYIEIQVENKKLLTSEYDTFHLDLWQNPFSVARIQNVELWSNDHFDALKPVMQMLADAGQDVITTSIIHKPWNGQTEDHFESMIQWVKRTDGSWYYDYSIFDKWVEFMMKLGINKQINCYTMVPWELKFNYLDEASHTIKTIKFEPGDKDYETFWVPMLKSFSTHLRVKGWFDITTIAMDERPMAVMQKTINIIHKADPEFKISLAGNYHSEIESDIYDYSISLSQTFPENVLLRRKGEGKISTYYTSCTHCSPNTFTFSDPAESVWLGFYLAKDEVDGFLRWAYNSWVTDPLKDSRFRSWAGGDTFLVYPEGRSSIRFEKLREGIQVYEKIKILKKEYTETNNTLGLKKIEEILSIFDLDDFPHIPAHVTVEKALNAINGLK